MNALVLNSTKKNFTFSIQIAVTAVFVFFLFCIDEGYNDLRWTQSPGNWIAYIVYIGLFSIGQMIAKLWLFKGDYNWWKSIVIGITGILLDIGIIMFLMLLAYLFK